MKDNIKFWVAVGTVSQLDFEGRTHSHEVPVGEQHIAYMDVLLCRQSRERLKAEKGAKKQRTVQNRIQGVKLCEKCEKKYKENPSLAWQRWAVSPEPKASAAIKLNPELHRVK